MSDRSTITRSVGKPVSGQTVLVTGGAGFIGTALTETLAADNEVRVLDHFSAVGDRDGAARRRRIPDAASIIDSDVRDTEGVDDAMAGVDIVYHLAAQVSVAESVTDPMHTDDVNVRGTVNVLERAREHDVRVVFASSAAVYGEPTTLPVSESEPKTPASPYGISKLAGDHYVRRYADLYGLETVALRFFNAYGFSTAPQSGVISTFAARAGAGEPLQINGDGEQTRDFVHVDDIVRAALLAGDTDAVGRAYNVATGTSVTLNELASLVKRLAPTDPPIEHRPPRDGDLRHSVADVSRAAEELGYEPSVSLPEGIATVLEGDAGRQAPVD